MANVQIITAGPSDLKALTDLYNEVFRPPQTQEFFSRRFLGRYNLTLLFATLDGQAVGFVAGFELKPTTYYVWLCGVLPDYRRVGVANQLLEALQAWATEHEYSYIRMECHNRHREVLRMAIELEYDIVGVRWDSERADNLVILEKTVGE